MSELGVVQQRIPIEIMFNETVENMLPGYPVEVKIITAEKMALAVPREAVFTVKNQDGVFIVKKRRAIFTPVEIGIEGEDYFEVLSGLVDGDLVILNPPKEIDDGVFIKLNC